ncbi:MAG TPA: oligosaccharide flippase family protein [Candidatus Limnocylindrales bacterium]|nr:oligosaccharide flippase family protein [Candidatus Limnocylindrales bacterium]
MIADLKNIAKHTSIYTLGNILTKVVGFFMIPIYTHYLSTSDYGILELLTLTSTILAMILGLRLPSALVRFYPESENMKDKNRLVSTILMTVVVISVGALCFLLPSREFISRWVFGSEAYSRHFTFIFVSLAFELCNAVSYTYLRILEKSGYFTVVSLLQLVLGLSLNIYFIVGLGWGVLGILMSMVISNGLICLLLVGYMLLKVKFHPDISQIPMLLKYTAPLILSGFFIFILNMGDRFLLNRLADLNAVGIYSLGYKFGMMLNIFVGDPFHLTWAPKRVEIYKRWINRNEVFRQVTTYLILILAFVGLIISILIKDVLIFIAAPEFLPAYRVVPWVVLGYAFYILYYVVDIGIFMNNKNFWYLTISFLAATLNLGLNFLLIPRLGFMGAAISTTVSFAFCPVMAFFISQKYYPVPYDFVRILKIILSALAIYWISSQISIPLPLLDILVKLVMIISYPITLYLIGFFEPEEIFFIKGRLFQRLGLVS